MFTHLNPKGILAIVISLFAVSCTHATQAGIDDKPRVQTHTEILRLTTVADTFQVPGTVRARTQTVVASQIAGQITSVRVHEGDLVRQGDLLVEIGSREASIQLRRAQAAEAEARLAVDELDGAIGAANAGLRAAEANRDLALATRKRYQFLRERGSVSPQEFDEVDAKSKVAASEAARAADNLVATKARRPQLLARIEQAKAEAEAADIAIGYLNISSPINGIVTMRKVEPGMLASPGTPLVAIEDDSTYQLESSIEESRVASIVLGQNVRIEIDALSASVDAAVREIVPASDPASRTYTVKLALALTPALRGKLHSGFFAHATFPAGERQTLLIPESALVERGQLTGVFVVKNNFATLRLVKLGKRYEKRLEILSGLSPDTRIVTAPDGQISDGVEIVENGREGTMP